MRVLVTGGSGFLGRHLVPHLKAQGMEVIAPTSRECNLTEKDDLRKYSNVTFDRIYHLAVYAKPGNWCLTHSGEQWLVNQQINTNVLWYWKQYNSQAMMVTFGSYCSYQPSISTEEKNYMVGEPERDLYTYAMTKRILYEGLRALNKQYGMNYTYLIPSNFYGPNFDINDSHFIFDLIKKISYGKVNDTEVQLWGDGHQIRELLYIDDALKLIDFAVVNCPNDILNLGNGLGYSIRQYVNMISNIVGLEQSKIKYDTSAFIGTHKRVFNISKLQRMTEFHFTPIHVGLNRTVDYYCAL